MGSKGKKTTTGYHYRVAYHVGLSLGPIDAFLEFRAADQSAWKGELTTSDRLPINAPDLFGGEKDQGGIVGPVSVAFGISSDMPNAYLTSVFGDRTVAWRGFATLAFEGGRYGANNPMPQKPAYKIRKILEGWDPPAPGSLPECWYPETAAVGTPPEPLEHIDTFPLFFEQINVGEPGYPERAPSLYDFDDRNVHPTSYTIGPFAHRVLIRNGDADGNLIGPWPFGTEALLLFNGSPNWQWAGNRFAIIPAGVPVTVQLLHIGGGDFIRGDGEISAFRYDATVNAMNPAHILYYTRTHGERGREPRDNINDASLRAAADQLHAEGFGLCTEFDPTRDTPASFEARICRIIGGSFDRSLEDGQWYLDLARGFYNIEALPVIDDDDIVDFRELPTTLDRAVNSIAVRYFDPEKKEKVITPAVRALGLIRQFGEIHEVLDFPEIPNGTLALRVAERELRARVTPVRAFELTTTPRKRHIRRNQYFRLQTPRRGIADMVCIVGSREMGTLRSGAIRWKVSQDVYALPDTTYIEIEEGEDTRPPSQWLPIQHRAAYEVPYPLLARALPNAELQALPPDTGYVQGVAANPGGMLDYTMRVRTTGPYGAPISADFPANGVVAAAADLGITGLVLTEVQGAAQVEAGMAALWDGEWCRVEAFSAAGGGAYNLSLGRGVAHSIRRTHAAGSRVWFVDLGVATDFTEYGAGQPAYVALTANTGTSSQPVATAPALTVDLQGLASLPYPPADARIDGARAPTAVEGPFTVTWKHRDRLLQADQLVPDSLADVGPDELTRYGLRVLDDADAVLLARTDIAEGPAVVTLPHTGDVTVELWTIDDVGESHERYRWTFAHTAAAGDEGIDAAPWTRPTLVIDGNDPT